ncbi:hypothetical protein ACLB1E_19785 [Escherichia coli]
MVARTASDIGSVPDPVTLFASYQAYTRDSEPSAEKALAPLFASYQAYQR